MRAEVAEALIVGDDDQDIWRVGSLGDEGHETEKGREEPAHERLQFGPVTRVRVALNCIHALVAPLPATPSARSLATG